MPTPDPLPQQHHIVPQDAVQQSRVLQMLRDNSKFDINAAENLLNLPNGAEFADAYDVTRHASNHVPFTASLVQAIEDEGRELFKGGTYLSLAQAGDVDALSHLQSYANDIRDLTAKALVDHSVGLTISDSRYAGYADDAARSAAMQADYDRLLAKNNIVSSGTELGAFRADRANVVAKGGDVAMMALAGDVKVATGMAESMLEGNKTWTSKAGVVSFAKTVKAMIPPEALQAAAKLGGVVAKYLPALFIGAALIEADEARAAGDTQRANRIVADAIAEQVGGWAVPALLATVAGSVALALPAVAIEVPAAVVGTLALAGTLVASYLGSQTAKALLNQARDVLSKLNLDIGIGADRSPSSGGSTAFGAVVNSENSRGLTTAYNFPPSQGSDDQPSQGSEDKNAIITVTIPEAANFGSYRTNVQMKWGDSEPFLATIFFDSQGSAVLAIPNPGQAITTPVNVYTGANSPAGPRVPTDGSYAIVLGENLWDSDGRWHAYAGGSIPVADVNARFAVGGVAAVLGGLQRSPNAVSTPETRLIGHTTGTSGTNVSSVLNAAGRTVGTVVTQQGIGSNGSLESKTTEFMTTSDGGTDITMTRSESGRITDSARAYVNALGELVSFEDNGKSVDQNGRPLAELPYIKDLMEAQADMAAAIAAETDKGNKVIVTTDTAGDITSLLDESDSVEIASIVSVAPTAKSNGSFLKDNRLETVIYRVKGEDGTKTLTSIQTAATIGSIFGSTLGRQLGGDDQFKAAILSGALGALTKSLVEGIGTATVMDFGQGLKTGLADLPFNLRDAAAGEISSYITAQLILAVGLDGVAGGIANAAGGAVIGAVVSNIAHGADTLDTIFKNAGSPLAIANAVGGYLGATLASEIMSFDTVGGQLGASLGSSIGGYVATTALVSGTGAESAFIGIKLGAAAGPVGAFVGALAGFVVGGVIGSLFGGTPRSGADVLWDDVSGKFVVTGAWSRKGGSKDAAQGLAGSAAQMLNNVLSVAGGRLLDGNQVDAGAYGMVKSDYVYRENGDVIASFAGTNGSGDLLDYGVYRAIDDIVQHLAGGDVYVKRAVATSIRNASGSDANFDVTSLIGNMSVARDWSKYRDNAVVYNALLNTSQSDDGSSLFAAGWTVTAARAIELGLDKRNATDWIGGFRSWLDEKADGKIDGRSIRPTNVTVIFDPGTHGRFFILTDAGGRVTDELVDTIENGDKTLVNGTAGNDAIIVTDDMLSDFSAGITVGNATATNGYKIGIAAVIDGGAGDDTIRGGDLGNDLLGGSGNDVLIGGKLDDYLSGGDGNDRLFAGNVVNPAPSDQASIDAALAVDGGNGNILDGGNGNDALYGGTGSDWLIGGTGADTLFGGKGGDILDAGANGTAIDDVAQGGAGSDQYVFRAGDGFLQIFDDETQGKSTATPAPAGDTLAALLAARNSGAAAKNWAGDDYYSVDGNVRGGEDSLVFGAGINLTDLVLQRGVANGVATQDLMIRVQKPDGTWNGDQITIKDWFDSARRVEWLKFDNGDEIRIGDVTSYILGTSGSDVLVGTLGSDFLYGFDGNDQLYGLHGDDYGFGGLGDDLVSGDDDADFVSGGAGRDTVFGGNGDDVVFGDDGDDYVSGYYGNDKIAGGKGNDTIVSGPGDDIILFSRGDGRDDVFAQLAGTWDTIWQNGAYINGYTQDPVTHVVSKAGRIVFDGTRYIGKYIYADSTKTLQLYNEPAAGSRQTISSGNDTIQFAAGIDIQDIELRRSATDLQMAVLPVGATGASDFDATADTITVKDFYWGGLTGQTVENFTFLSTGTLKTSDTKVGAATGVASDGADTLVGSAGKDWITGNAGDDTIDGGDGDDILNGNDGADTLKGGAGSDVLYGGTGANVLEGGAGADILIGGSGQDTASYATAAAGLRAYLGFAGDNTGDAAGDVFSSIEGITGSAFADRLGGDEGDNVLTGGGGADTLLGGAGNDTYVVSSAASATIIDQPYSVSSGLERFTTGNGGDDTLEVDNITSFKNLSFEFSGNDLLVTIADAAGTATATLKDWKNIDRRIEHLAFGDGYTVDLASLVLAGSAASGTSGNDVIVSTVALTASGGDGNDILVGGASSKLIGGNGDDVFEGGAGTDYDGGAGGDTIRFTQGPVFASLYLQQAYMYAGGQVSKIVGIEKLIGSDGNDTFVGYAGDNKLFGGAGDDNIEDAGGGNDVIAGGAGNDNLRGGSGSDDISGGDGLDYIDGGDDDDVIDTGAGGDTAHGANGNDIVIGGSGADVLYGENGSDLLDGSDGDDILYGGNDDDCTVRDENSGKVVKNGGLFGGNGNDIIYGEAGNDELAGGGGDDALIDTAGNDTYFFDVASGHDTIIDADGKDRIVYNGSSSDVWLNRAGNGLKVIFNGGTASVLVKDYFAVTNACQVRTIEAGGNTLYLDFARDAGGLIDQMTALGSVPPAAIPNKLQAMLSDLWVAGGQSVPKAQDLVLTMDEDGTLYGGPTAIDYDGDVLHYILSNDKRPQYGVLTYDSAGHWIYVPFSNWHTDSTHPADSWEWEITDDDGNMVRQKATLTVNSVNDQPSGINFAPSMSAISENDHLASGMTAVGAIVLGTLAADDVNDASVHTPDGSAPFDDAWDYAGFVYTVSDSRFSIVFGSGGKPVLQLNTGVVLDYETAQTIGVDVTATDRLGAATGLSVSKRFTFTVADRDDYIYGNGVATKIAGAAGRDIIGGTNINENISGLGGDDEVSASGGDDIIFGGDGKDALHGGLGIDTIWGDAGEDNLFGDEGDDELHGGAGNDILYGGWGPTGIGTGNDLLFGDAGNDALYGADGDDVLIGGSGADILNGGIYGSNTASYQFTDGGVRNTAGVTASLADPSQNTGDAAGDTYINIQNLRGGPGADNFTGNALGNILQGNLGNDTLNGLAGNDTLDGSIGNDSLYGGDGDDTLSGGADGGETGDIDWLDGGIGNDILLGGSDNDTLLGGTGDDALTAGQGNDLLAGGAGNDTYIIRRFDGTDTIDQTGAPLTDVDRIGFQANATGVIQIIENRHLWFSKSGNDVMITVLGNSGVDNAVVLKDFSSNFANGIANIRSIIAGAEQTTPLAVPQIVDLMAAVIAAGRTAPTTIAQFQSLYNDASLQIGGRSFKALWDNLWTGNAFPVINGPPSATLTEDANTHSTQTLSFAISDDNTTLTAQAPTLKVVSGYGSRSAVSDISLISDISSATIAGTGTSGTASFTYHLAPYASGTAWLWLHVNDAGNADGQDSWVQVNVSPIANAPVLTITAAQGNAGGVGIALNVAAISPDTDGSEAVSSFTIGNVPAGFAFGGRGTNLGNGSWRFSPAEMAGLRLYAPDGHASDLNLSVSATSTESNGQTATSSGSLAVSINAPPSSFTAAGSLQVSENVNAQTLVGRLQANDADGNPLDYSLVNDPSGNFIIGSDGNVYLKAGRSLNFETQNQYTITARVSESGVALPFSVDQNFTIAVVDQNERPGFSSLGSFTAVENSAAGTGIGSIAAVDPDGGTFGVKQYYFVNGAGASVASADGNYSIASNSADGRYRIDPDTGTISVTGGLDYEAMRTPVSYQVLVKDGTDTPRLATGFATIGVGDANEAPTMAAGTHTFAVNEESQSPLGAGTGYVGQVSAFDPDTGGTANSDLRYVITGGTGAGLFDVTADGRIYMVNRVDYETMAHSYSLQVNAVDNSGNGLSSNTANVSININPVAELPVAIIDPTYRTDSFWFNDASNGQSKVKIDVTDPEGLVGITATVLPGSGYQASWTLDRDPSTGAYRLWVTGPRDAGYYNGSLNIRFTDSTGLSTTVTAAYTLHTAPINNGGKPIVLDLNGDGIGLVSVYESPVTVDVDGDGAPEHVGWFGPQDGVLALDRNGDGSISVFNEISFMDDKQGAVSDLEGLAAFDTNGNGLFEQGDASFGRFQIWQDFNQDGVSQKDELSSLVDRGVAAIDLRETYTGETPVEATDNILYGLSSYIRTNGTSGEVGDVMFASMPVSLERDGGLQHRGTLNAEVQSSAEIQGPAEMLAAIDTRAAGARAARTGSTIGDHASPSGPHSNPSLSHAPTARASDPKSGSARISNVPTVQDEQAPATSRSRTAPKTPQGAGRQFVPANDAEQKDVAPQGAKPTAISPFDDGNIDGGTGPSRRAWSTSPLASLIDRYSLDQLGRGVERSLAQSSGAPTALGDATLTKLLERMAAFHNGAGVGMVDGIVQKGGAEAGIANLAAANTDDFSSVAWR